MFPLALPLALARWSVHPEAQDPEHSSPWVVSTEEQVAEAVDRACLSSLRDTRGLASCRGAPVKALTHLRPSFTPQCTQGWLLLAHVHSLFWAKQGPRTQTHSRVPGSKAKAMVEWECVIKAWDWAAPSIDKPVKEQGRKEEHRHKGTGLSLSPHTSTRELDSIEGREETSSDSPNLWSLATDAFYGAAAAEPG